MGLIYLPFQCRALRLLNRPPCKKIFHSVHYLKEIRKRFPYIQVYLRWLSGKYPAILNISRTGHVALMYLGSQSEETLLFIREQSLSRGASQSAVRRCWLSSCTAWPSQLQWPSEQISFITTMRLRVLQLSCRLFWQSITSLRTVSPPLQPRFGSPRILALPKTKIAVENEGICEFEGHAVRKLSQGSLTADRLAPRESVHGWRETSPLTGCQVTSRPREGSSRYSKWPDTFRTAIE